MLATLRHSKLQLCKYNYQVVTNYKYSLYIVFLLYTMHYYLPRTFLLLKEKLIILEEDVVTGSRGTKPKRRG